MRKKIKSAKALKCESVKSNELKNRKYILPFCFRASKPSRFAVVAYIDTPHLILRSWQRSDFVPFAEMNADPQVMEFFLDTLNVEESKEMFVRISEEINTRGYGMFAVEEKASGSFIGFTGFHYIPSGFNFAPAVEIAWRIRPEYWNKGYATEAARACLDYARARGIANEIYAFTSLPNKRSERVMQKAGMSKVAEFSHPKVPAGHFLEKHVLYKTEL